MTSTGRGLAWHNAGENTAAFSGRHALPQKTKATTAAASKTATRSDVSGRAETSVVTSVQVGRTLQAARARSRTLGPTSGPHTPRIPDDVQGCNRSTLSLAVTALAFPPSRFRCFGVAAHGLSCFSCLDSAASASPQFAGQLHVGVAHAVMPRQSVCAAECLLLGAQIAPNLLLACIVYRVLVPRQVVWS